MVQKATESQGGLIVQIACSKLFRPPLCTKHPTNPRCHLEQSLTRAVPQLQEGQQVGVSMAAELSKS